MEFTFFVSVAFNAIIFVNFYIEVLVFIDFILNQLKRGGCTFIRYS